MRAFNTGDIPEIHGWLEKWGSRKEPNFPPIGVIEPGVAVGFLVRAECGVCFLEGYVNNPKSKKELRRKAEIEITRTLITYAMAHGFKKIIAITKNRFIASRAEKIHKFKPDTKMHYLSLEV